MQFFLKKIPCQYLKEQIANKLKGIYQAFKKMFDFFSSLCFIVRLTFSALVLCEGMDCSPLLRLI